MTTISNGVAGIPASLKSTVLALQKTQTQIDQVQQRLATGQRVSSAIDDPGNYFKASALNQRATGLNNAVDRIVQQLGLLQSADDSVTSLQSLVTQAQGIAESAQEELTGTDQVAKITGDRNLANITDLPGDLAGVDNGDVLRFRFVDNDGSINTANSVTIANSDSSSDLVDSINAIVDSGAAQVFDASLNSSGQLSIKTKDNTRFEIEFESSGGAADTQLATALGFGDFATTATTDGTAETRITVQSTASLTSVSLFSSAGGSATASTTLVNLTHTSGGSTNDIFRGDSGDTLKIGVNGDTAVTVTSAISTATVQDLIDGINDNASLNTKIEASFDADTAELNIRAIDSDVESIQIQLAEDGTGTGTAGKIDLQRLGFGTRILINATDGSSNTYSESIHLGVSAGALADYEGEYNTLLEQIDELVNDAEYSGVNLLNGDDSTASFNEDASSTLTTQGSTLTADGLGLSDANFGNSSNISTAVIQTENALTEVQTFATSLANDIAILQTRQDFTEQTVNTLQASADDLTVSDANEDAAMLLALQTRQLLGVTALSLGTQSQQSTLRLF